MPPFKNLFGAKQAPETPTSEPAQVAMPQWTPQA